MAIKVIDAYEQRGWDNYDYLIDDSRIQEVIGNEYSTLHNAFRAVQSRASRGGPVAIEYIDLKTNERWLKGNEPNIPGRQRLSKFLGDE